MPTTTTTMSFGGKLGKQCLKAGGELRALMVIAGLLVFSRSAAITFQFLVGGRKREREKNRRGKSLRKNWQGDLLTSKIVPQTTHAIMLFDNSGSVNASS